MSGRKTQVHTKLPWTGGLNTALDPGVISDNDLTIADNIVFASSGARIKREGFQYLDSDIPEIVAISSSGTTRTIIFKDPINTTSNDILVAGEAIAITADSYSDFEGDFDIATVTDYVPSTDAFVDGDVDVADDEITLTAHSYYTGLVGQLTTTGALPAGLALTTDYYIIVIDEDTVSLASSLEDAIAGIAVDITAAAGTGTHTFTPAALSTDNALTYTASGSLTLPVTSILDQADISIIKNYTTIGVHDFWYVQSNLKTQRIVAVTSQGKFFRFDINGNRKEITKESGATALTAPTRVSFLVSNNMLLMGFDKVGNTPKKYNPVVKAEWEDLDNAPDFDVMQLHLGRVFANDKTDLDRLHYSEPNDPEVWGGVGDSGAIDILQGDGDSRGIISIAKPFKGRMFLSKGRRIVDLLGDSPENFRPRVITEGLGMISHNAIVPVDVDDLMFVSERGFHSLAATDSHGDFEGAFLSQSIQPTFNDFNKTALNTTHGVYIPNINSILYSIADEGATNPNMIYGFNTMFKTWFRWPDIDCYSLGVVEFTSNDRRPLIGTSTDGRILLGNSGAFEDYNEEDINYLVTTGTIYPGNDPQSLKMFKRVTLYFRSKGDFNFFLNYKIDNNIAQSVVFEQVAATDLLGASFFLGSSILGADSLFAPQTRSIDGIGRGISLSIESSNSLESIEIYGYAIEWEPADLNQESL